MDLRVGKLFRVRGYQFEADMDIYNLTHENTVYSVRTNTGRTSVRYAADPTAALVSFPMYKSPINVLGPRIARFNVSYKF